jgi:hypothetical protein
MVLVVNAARPIFGHAALFRLEDLPILIKPDDQIAAHRCERGRRTRNCERLNIGCGFR